MAGETHIIAFGGKAPESAGAPPIEQPSVEAPEEALADGHEDDVGEPSSFKTWMAPIAAACTALAWTGFYLWSQQARIAAADPAAVSEMVVQWSVPILLIVTLWLLGMRHSRREAGRFADAAAMLSRESRELEARLKTVNGELGLARDFIAAQARDLDTLGRVATERLSQHAGRLQDLVRENGEKVETIGTVSRAALENMDMLRGQLPVVASSARDITNNIATAGRTAQAQLEELVGGFNRLNEFGAASERQVEAVRRSVDGATGEFARICEELDQLARSRFDALTTNGREFRTQLEAHEVEALAAIRARAATLAQELEHTRATLDGHEAESLNSLRARLSALRDEGGTVGRALRESEARAAEAWQDRLSTLDAERTALGALIDADERKTLEAMRERFEHLKERSRELQGTLDDANQHAIVAIEERLRQLEERAAAMQARIAGDEQAAVIRISAQLASLDGAIAQRLADHERASRELAARADGMTAKFDLHGERMGAVAETAGALESRIAGSLAALEERLTASKATLAATDGEVERLTDASVRLLELIQASAKHSTSVLPEALAIAEDRLVRAGETLTRLIIDLDQGQARGEAVIETIEGGQERLTTLLQELEAAQDAISARADAHRSAFAGLQASLADIERSGERVEAKTRDELGAAITEVEDAVRAALSALDREGPTLIRSLADKLGDESGQAIERAMRPRVAEATGALEQAIAHASGAGREASLQLREQITAVSDLTASLENRVAQARERAEEQVDNDFSRRVALITDALNSNAIDIATALSSDIGDTAWSAYLRGDRGIFTRRAVSLLSANDVRAIQQLFERDDSFREHVSRYIHDFEALLRQVLSTRDGNALGVTLLSSDMGKLYVALAQGIERLRN
jgi:hypothetical protein